MYVSDSPYLAECLRADIFEADPLLDFLLEDYLFKFRLILLCVSPLFFSTLLKFLTVSGSSLSEESDGDSISGCDFFLLLYADIYF